MSLSREDILGLQDLEVHQIDVPHWGKVYIRMMTASERVQVEDLVQEIDNDQAGTLRNLRSLVAVFCVCDERGKNLFTRDDIPLLEEKNAKALDFILKAVEKQSAMHQSAVEDAAGN